MEKIKLFDVEVNSAPDFKCKKFIVVGMWFCYVAMNNTKHMLGLPHIKSVKQNGKEIEL